MTQIVDAPAKPELVSIMGDLMDSHGIDHILRAFAAACRAKREAVLVRHADTPHFAHELQAICERNATRLDACNHGNAALFAATCEQRSRTVTQIEYKQYEARFAAFMAAEGIDILAQAEGEEEGSFSWRPCDCCESALGGTRYTMTGGKAGVGPNGQKYEVCEDCLYYSVSSDSVG